MNLKELCKPKTSVSLLHLRPLLSWRRLLSFEFANGILQQCTNIQLHTIDSRWVLVIIPHDVYFICSWILEKAILCLQTYIQTRILRLPEPASKSHERERKGKEREWRRKKKVGINRHRILILPTLNDKNDVRRTHWKAQPSSIVF